MITEQESLTKLHHVLVSLVYVCDELLEESVGKSLLYGWSVQLLWLHTSRNTKHSLKVMGMLHTVQYSRYFYTFSNRVIYSPQSQCSGFPTWTQCSHWSGGTSGCLVLSLCLWISLWQSVCRKEPEEGGFLHLETKEQTEPNEHNVWTLWFHSHKPPGMSTVHIELHLPLASSSTFFFLAQILW